MNKQLDLVSNKASLSTLPSAKVEKNTLEGVHAWTRFYASFSESFAQSALNALIRDEHEVILDPFVGSGTTLLAAAKGGYQAQGVDLDPFACLLSRAKVAVFADYKQMMALLQPCQLENSAEYNFTDQAYELFSEDCLRYAATVFSRIQAKVAVGAHAILDTLLADSVGTYDSETAALLALCIGASDSCKVVQGSNPTWYRKASEGEKDTLTALSASTLSAAGMVASDLASLKPDILSRDSAVQNLDFTALHPNAFSQKVDLIITSPPYLTRMDYVVKHLPHLLILSGILSFDIDTLRRKMIGTPKICDKSETKPEWGPSCNSALERILNHSSYASESYYYWTYHQYFKKLYQSFDNFKRALKNDGRGIIVLQDSVYKDVPIELSQIAIEMLSNLSMTASITSSHKVTRNMRQLNPTFKASASKPYASEDAVYFSNSTQ